MQKRLILFRHAKSSWGDPAAADFDRPLNARGRRDAPRMGLLIADVAGRPDLVLCSTARRAEETWTLAAPAFVPPVPIKALKRLYLAPPDGILETVRAVPEEVATAVVVAHNPGLHQLAMGLAAAQGGAERVPPALRENFPTAAVAVFAVEGEGWHDLRPEGCRLLRFVRPKELG